MNFETLRKSDRFDLLYSEKQYRVDLIFKDNFKNQQKYFALSYDEFSELRKLVNLKSNYYDVMEFLFFYDSFIYE